MGLRWRTQREVVSGRGQFVCGAKVGTWGGWMVQGIQCGGAARFSTLAALHLHQRLLRHWPPACLVLHCSRVLALGCSVAQPVACLLIRFAELRGATRPGFI